MPLLHKEVVIDTVNLIEPEVYLAVNADGAANWEFSKPQAGANGDLTEENTQAEIVAAPVTVDTENIALPVADATPLLAGFMAKQVKIKDARLVYQDMASDTVTNLQINSLTLQTESMNADFCNTIHDMNFYNILTHIFPRRRRISSTIIVWDFSLPFNR